jgi:purine-binding chemotaxis protein CheW
MEQYTTFFSGEALYGISILAVREINPHLEITEVPLAASYISGLVNLRGQVVTVIDLGEKLGIGKQGTGHETHLMIIKTNAELSDIARGSGIKTSDDPVGLLVGQIGDVVAAEAAEIEPPPANMEIKDTRYVRGVVKLEDSLLTLLNLDQILGLDPEQGMREE